MRIRSPEPPPSKNDVDRIIRQGASGEDKKRLPALLRRLRQSFFLDSQDQPLSARARMVRQYKNDGLVLFLGAGISVESGIPSWPKLAHDVLVASGVATEQVNEVMRALPSHMAQFGLARQLLGTERELVATIYRELYKHLECKHQLEKIPRKYEQQRAWPGWGDILKVLECNQTLKEVGNLLVLFDGTKPRRNPQIHAVLTSNADNLLELYCEAKTNGKRVVTMVDRPSVGEDPDQIPIYHLHGTLDARGENLLRSGSHLVPPDELQEISDEMLPELVFQESEYYETIANPASFVNHMPQSLLRRLNALFVGTSLDDLNMRRWLNTSFHERVRHRTSYLREFYWRRYPDAEHDGGLESVRHFWIRPEVEGQKNGQLWQVPKGHVDRVMGTLGVQVVWCKDYDDVQRCLGELQKLGHDPEFGRKAADYPT
jgi:SIR2-like domain